MNSKSDIQGTKVGTKVGNHIASGLMSREWKISTNSIQLDKIQPC